MLNNYNMDSELILSKEWWRGLAELIGLPSTSSVLILYCIIIIGLSGLALVRLNKRLPKILFVICIGVLELYYFGYYGLNPDWFLSTDVSWLQRLLTVPILATVLTVQCILTDDIFLNDSLTGDQRHAVDNGICFSPLLLSALYCILVYIISRWIKSDTFAILIGYIALLCIVGITARLIQVKRLGNIAVLLFFVTIISLSGVLITSSYCILTGFISLFAYISVSSKRDMRSVAYSIKLKADAGDPKSIYRMGRIYLIGDGIPKDEHKAVEFFQKSADSGNAKAYNDLARCYLNGTGANASKQKAIECAKKSVALGCSEAKVTLGDIYFEMAKDFRDGKGVVKDERKAISLFEQAGEYGNSKAYNSLAKCYLSGTGVTKDGQKGLEYATKSYEMGNKNACATIGTYYRMGDFIPVDHINGHKWDIIGAQAGNVLCQIRVGIDFQNGYGTPENKREACKWYKKVADNKEASQKDRGMASYRYGVLIGILGNIPEGKEYIRKAQRLGNQIAIKEGNKYLNS
jgi:TPR repeat protein